MSEPIKAGDLTVVVKTCCPEKSNVYLGVVRQIADVHYGVTLCEHCGHKEIGSHARSEDRVRQGKVGAPLWWLKRIPPLSELDSEKRDEEITA